MKRIYAISTALTLVCATSTFAVDKTVVLDTYADIAAAKYQDSLITAQTLGAAVDALLATPSAEALQTAKEAWLAARIPYQQTEVYRFGNPIVDDWEGKVNAWPLDEGLIDYVSASYGGPTDEKKLWVSISLQIQNFLCQVHKLMRLRLRPNYWPKPCTKRTGSVPM